MILFLQFRIQNKFRNKLYIYCTYVIELLDAILKICDIQWKNMYVHENMKNVKYKI